ncbi:sulfate/molybdate ABC transporter ATP-binding protein [uncultured Schumannella sp.]|uniref:sulfate/molybdate ABC transporter ATP-binding protein n=1 Tax=uncultured Schumannella sp. TaxID=1195956 RepID=UPI0025EA79FA|nr:ABC transporter ATP-binding protein [uncultured Schumannella sp.]
MSDRTTGRGGAPNPAGGLDPGLVARIEAHRGDVDLRLEITATPGLPVALVGPNGAGKSTTLAVLAGAHPLDAGRIALGGRVLAGDGVDLPPERRGIGLVFQDYVLFGHLTVRDNIGFAERVKRGRPAGRAAAEPWLERFGLTALADRLPAELSGGQAQRVALARALAAEPRLLLLDEPMAALDVEVRAEVRTELGELLRGLPIPTVIVTHSRADVEALGDEVIVVEAGEATQRGSVAELRAHPATPYVTRLFATPPE